MRHGLRLSEYPKRLALLAVLTATAALTINPAPAWATTAAESDTPDRWLLDAADDDTRFERLEQYLGGFSAAMWETKARYVRVHEALAIGNRALALYHWEKIGSAIRGGYLKRPARRANADALFLDNAWPEAAKAFEEGDDQRAWEAFTRARAACMACHVAEDVAFMNEQAIFTELVAPSTASDD
ncbi:MAG: hypothetical protein JJU27_13940 [Gammaproteobacteria bacterium]|nr:hypothetical protein [Gammaproteobacteria bacterium]